MPRTKPQKDHRCDGATLSVRVKCECGWRSSEWVGKGARANAYAEWRSHIYAVSIRVCPRARAIPTHDD